MSPACPADKVSKQVKDMCLLKTAYDNEKPDEEIYSLPVYAAQQSAFDINRCDKRKYCGNYTD